MRFIRVPFGEGHLHEPLADGEDVPEGAVLIPRLPEPHEAWDGTGWALDAVAAADAQEAARLALMSRLERQREARSKAHEDILGDLEAVGAVTPTQARRMRERRAERVQQGKAPA